MVFPRCRKTVFPYGVFDVRFLCHRYCRVSVGSPYGHCDSCFLYFRGMFLACHACAACIDTHLKQKHLYPDHKSAVSMFQLEITETCAMEKRLSVIGNMHAMSAMGFHFSIDDFGTGMSNFDYIG